MWQLYYARVLRKMFACHYNKIIFLNGYEISKCHVTMLFLNCLKLILPKIENNIANLEHKQVFHKGIHYCFLSKTSFYVKPKDIQFKNLGMSCFYERCSVFCGKPFFLYCHIEYVCVYVATLLSFMI